MKKTSLLFVWILCITLAVSALAEQNKSNKDAHWVGTWACAPMADFVPPPRPPAAATTPAANPTNTAPARPAFPPPPNFTDATLRQIVHVSIGGSQVRVRFSNAFGTSPLVITSAHIALPAKDGAIDPSTDKALSFNGQPSATIPAGALMISDPIAFNLAPLSDLAVTIHLDQAPEGITTHPDSQATSFVQAGNAVSAANFTSAQRVDHWYFLNGIDVMAGKSAAAVVTFGDSITDGARSGMNTNTRWPDDLARRLQANKKTKDVAVLNEGISGNRILHDRSGPNALARLDRDVLSQDGVRWLIVLEGINDIGGRKFAATRHEQVPTAQDLIGGYRQIIARAHAHNIRVYGATILPYMGAFYSTPEGEADRQAVNEWIRTSGEFDGVIDLDAATRDAKDPSRMAAAVDSGDHLHPKDAGYQTMANAINLALFKK